MPPHVNVIKPMVIKGSSGIWPTKASMSARLRTCAPRIKPLRPVPIEEPSWYQRRDLRSLKKVFQSRRSVEWKAAWEVEGWGDVAALEMEDAQRMLVLGLLDLNKTLRFETGTRRLGVEVFSCGRTEGEEVVW